MNSPLSERRKFFLSRDFLEKIYADYNRRDLVHPDPLEFLFLYDNPRDIEVVGLIASSLALGKVEQILKSVRKALDICGKSPFDFILSKSHADMKVLFANFKHRVFTGEQMAAMLAGAGAAARKYGSLENCFAAGLKSSDKTVIPALEAFADEINGFSGTSFRTSLLPAPSAGSACKRVQLYLRWMVRKDIVDPGIWTKAKASQLIVPVDVHMGNIGRSFGLSSRKSSDIKTAVEITDAFRETCPEDPVKYDFALTRFGIHPDMEMKDLLSVI